MTKTFRDKLIKLRDTDTDLFYNSSGSPEAYKLNIKHLSAAPSFGYAILQSKKIVPIKIILLVDFEKEEIIELNNSIELIPITILK